MKKFTLLLLSCVLPVAANAEPSMLPLSLQHKASVEVSTGIGTGNIDNQNYKIGGKLISTHNKYTNEMKGSYADVDAKNSDSESLYHFNNKLKYSVGSSSYAFGEGEYLSNKVAGVDSRSTGLVGYGQELIKNDDFDVTGELGAGYRQSNYKAGLADEASIIGRAGTDMNWGFYRDFNLNNNTSMAFTENNTQTISDTSVTKPIYKGAYVKGGVAVENNTSVPAGYEKTDTVTSVGLGYEF
jgi:putative salt-induced outer membrane protein